MAKEELLEFDGTVTEVLPDGNFRVKLDNEHEVLAYTAGKMRKFRIRTGVGDRVIVEMSPYDLQRGRISFRHKGDAPAAVPAAAPAEFPPRVRRTSRRDSGARESIRSCMRAMQTLVLPHASRWRLSLAGAFASASARRRQGSHAGQQQPRRTAGPRRRACGCCRPIPSPSIPSTRRAGQARLHGDRRHAGVLRPIRRAKRGGVLHRLCRKERRRQPAADLRLQRRPGRGVRLSASRPRRPAHSRFRTRPRDDATRAVLRDNPDTWLRLHRPGLDRPDRHRLEPRRQSRRRQVFLERERATPARWPRRSRSTSPKTIAPARRNICSAKAMAASAPPRPRALCRASRASTSTAS